MPANIESFTRRERHDTDRRQGHSLQAGASRIASRDLETVGEHRGTNEEPRVPSRGDAGDGRGQDSGEAAGTLVEHDKGDVAGARGVGPTQSDRGRASNSRRAAGRVPEQPFGGSEQQEELGPRVGPVGRKAKRYFEVCRGFAEASLDRFGEDLQLGWGGVVRGCAQLAGERHPLRSEANWQD